MGVMCEKRGGMDEWDGWKWMNGWVEVDEMDGWGWERWMKNVGNVGGMDEKGGKIDE